MKILQNKVVKSILSVFCIFVFIFMTSPLTYSYQGHEVVYSGVSEDPYVRFMEPESELRDAISTENTYDGVSGKTIYIQP